jgi:hypothetical protein
MRVRVSGTLRVSSRAKSADENTLKIGIGKMSKFKKVALVSGVCDGNNTVFGFVRPVEQIMVDGQWKIKGVGFTLDDTEMIATMAVAPDEGSYVEGLANY